MFLSKVGKIYHIYYTNPNTGKRTKISTKEKTKRNALRYLYNFGNRQRPKNVKKSLIEFKLEIMQYAKIHYSKSTIDLFKRSLKMHILSQLRIINFLMLSQKISRSRWRQIICCYNKWIRYRSKFHSNSIRWS